LERCSITHVNASNQRKDHEEISPIWTKYPEIVLGTLRWDSEREVYIKKDKSRLKDIEIVDRKECEELKSL